MTNGIPYKNSLDTCDHVEHPSDDFCKFTELKKGLE
jgi:hypothetical protein